MPFNFPAIDDARWPPAISPLNVIRAFKENPAETQVALLRRLTRKAAQTEWGKRFGFAEIAAAPDPVRLYQERVPVHHYEEYRADVDRVRHGEADIFWPGTFSHFAVSSGTASAGKIIPLSSEMLAVNRRFTLTVAMAYFEAKADPSFLFGRLMSVPGRIEDDPVHPGSWIGEVSGLQFLVAPWAIKRFYQAVPEDILFMPNWEQKLDAMVAHTHEMDIRAIAMVPSWAPVLFRKLIAHHNNVWQDSVTTIKEIWPNLEVFFSGGVALSSYRSLLEEQIGGGMDFVENYGASEGYISFQDIPNVDDMLVHLDTGVFLEFEPVDGSGPRVFIDSVETGVRYRIYVSTCSGLWAYEVGDVVMFTSTDPFRLVVAGRTNEVLDTYGEAVYGDEARQALEKASDLTGAKVANYHIAPIPASSASLPGHEWLIEFIEMPDSFERFSTIIDAHLQEINRHYIIRREADAFLPPKISPLTAGTFFSWLRQTKKKVSAQTKVPRMSEAREIAEALLKISGNYA
ncbi:MAG: GH3 auxin-responsive promoter family protein [Bacteroidetes bacterium]|nr:GH3 auxin-responsive promoter family protein [Bacteroidota bacterium]MDA1333300.1 GH3 auxin-responsive promoter family protein [Bacteroidota bacterium]